MNIAVVTLFPEMFENILNSSILKRAQEKKKAKIDIIQLRDFGIGSHKTVDDKPYGGGAGMVLKVDVLHKAIMHAKKLHKKTKVILMDPRGVPFSQEIAENLSHEKNITVICGHYEGYDERVREYVDMEISLGDFVLTGGEIPALAVIDATVRLLPGVLGKVESFQHESFSIKDGKRTLEHPHYTRPYTYKGSSVPKELLSGDPKKVSSLREKEAQQITEEKRPDLLNH